MTTFTRTCLLALAALGASACAPLQTVDCTTGQYTGWVPGQGIPLSPRVDCGFGDAVNIAVARQVLDPAAATRNAARTAAGMDGIAAREAVDRYLRSFRAPEPTPSVFDVGVSGQGSSR